MLTPLQRQRGLPIGNLTSQFFGNIYLNSFDNFIKEQLKVKKYVRYVDDFALFSDDHQFLVESRQEIEAYLTQLRFKIHPIKSQLLETRHGPTFLGFRIFPSHIRVRRDNLKRGRKRLRRLQQDHAAGKIEPQKIAQSVQSWFAHLQHGDTWQLRQRIFASLAESEGVKKG